jgi:ubiquinone/menaquinone biosynthesis C-methylase UbiE
MTTWGEGDYPQMAQRLEPAALAVVDLAAVRAGESVLDVATGTGNAALLAAARGADVTGIDFEPALLSIAAQRGIESGQRIQWIAGDLMSLPVPDRSADVVLSVFGVMYAADHEVAARELARVAAPAARIVLASWLPGSVMPAMGHVLGRYLTPPPASTGQPSRWGDAESLTALLSSAGLTMATTTRQRITLYFVDASQAADFLIRTAGHVVSEQQRLESEGRWDDLRHDLTDFVTQHAEPTTHGIELPLDDLLSLASNEN